MHILAVMEMDHVHYHPILHMAFQYTYIYTYAKYDAIELDVLRS
jgi:hypothetical protein